jgi:hypothetical protein
MTTVYVMEGLAALALLALLGFIIYWSVNITADGFPILVGKLEAARLRLSRSPVFRRAAKVALVVAVLYGIVFATAVVSYHRGQHS